MSHYGPTHELKQACHPANNASPWNDSAFTLVWINLRSCSSMMFLNEYFVKISSKDGVWFLE